MLKAPPETQEEHRSCKARCGHMCKKLCGHMHKRYVCQNNAIKGFKACVVFRTSWRHGIPESCSLLKVTKPNSWLPSNNQTL